MYIYSIWNITETTGDTQTLIKRTYMLVAVSGPPRLVIKCPTFGWIRVKGWVEKKLLFEKIVIALEGERFVLGGCPSHHLLYS